MANMLTTSVAAAVMAITLSVESGDSRADPSDVPRSEATSSLSIPVVHSAVVLAGMRTSLSLLWPEPFHPFRFTRNQAQFRESYRLPPQFDGGRSIFESDGDPWTINVIGHGLFGSEIYLRFRQCGQSPVGALAATTVASTLWEYGIEAFHKRPSTFDLIWTPTVGALLGEGRWQLYRFLRGDGRDRPRGGRAVLLFVVDPFGEAERRVLDTRC